MNDQGLKSKLQQNPIFRRITDILYKNIPADPFNAITPFAQFSPRFLKFAQPTGQAVVLSRIFDFVAGSAQQPATS